MDWDHIIHKYINHTLTSEEQNLFNRLYKQEEDFRAEVEMITDLQQVIESNNQDNLKMIMDEAEAELISSKNQGSNPFIRNWWIVVVILFLLASLIGYYLLNSRPSSTQLYATYYNNPPNSYYPVTRGEPNLNDISMAFLAYEQKDFAKAEELLSALSPNDDILFYRAVSLGELGEFHNAIDLLKNINTEDPILREDVWWYKGLYHLALSDIESAKISFQNLRLTTIPSRKQLVSELLD